MFANFDSGVAPTGTITFYDGATAIPGTVTYTSRPGQSGGLSPTITGSINATFTTSGTHAITAKYSGDASYAAATSGVWNAAVLWPTAMTETASSTNVNYGQSVTVTAQVTTSGKTPTITGTFQFYGSYTAIPGPVTPTLATDANGNQVLTATVTTTPAAAEVIQVTYSGDGDFQGSSQQVYVNVNIPDFSLAPPNGVSVLPVAGQAGSATITITPTSQTPSTVALNFGNGYGPNTISGYTIAISPQLVSLNGVAMSAAVLLTPTVAIQGNAIRSQAGHAVLVGIGRGGWWTLSGISAIGALLLLWLPVRQQRYRLAMGFGVVCVLAFAMGCGGGSSGGGGGGGGGNPPGPTSITVITSNAKTAQFTPYTITVSVTSTKSLTGSISIYDFGNLITNAGLVNGQVQFNGSAYFGNIGIHQITASYSGDTNNLSSKSTALTQVVTGSLPMFIQGSTGGDIHNIQVNIGVQ